MALAVCAAPAAAGIAPVSPDEVAETRIRDIVSWIAAEHAWLIPVLALVSVLILIRLKVFRPGGLDEGARDVKPIPATMWLFAAMTAFLGQSLGAAAAAGVPILEAAPIKGQALQMVVSFGLAAVFGLGLLWFVGRQAGSAGVKLGAADVPIGLGAMVLVYPLVALGGLIGLWIALGIGAVEPDPVAHKTLMLIAQHQGDPWVWLLIGVLVVLVPIVEELIYRVYLQSAMLRLVRSRWLAVVLTSLFFTAAHWPVLPEGGKHAAAALFVLSVAMGAAYERTGRLGVPIAMHGAFNAWNLMLVFIIDPMV